METKPPPHAPPVANSFSRALYVTLIAVLVCTGLVVVCYFFVDRPVARLVYDHKLDRFEFLKVLTYPPPWVQAWSPAIIVLLIAVRAFFPLPRFLYAIFLACLSLIIADQFRTSLGDVCGRYWPETWFNNNPSFIGTGAYGFHPFQSGDDVGSFPSGHAARILGFVTVFWLTIPLGRLLYALLALPMLVALVGMNYHFVGDVIAGSFLGGIVGGYAVLLADFKKADAQRLI